MKLRVLCLSSAFALVLAGAVSGQTDGTRVGTPQGGASGTSVPQDTTTSTGATDYEADAATDVDDTSTMDSDPYATTGTADGVEDDADALPQTASPLAALALTGVASLAGALGLRRRRN